MASPARGKGEASDSKGNSDTSDQKRAAERVEVDLTQDRDGAVDDDGISVAGDAESAERRSRVSGPIQANTRALCDCGKTSGFPNDFDLSFHDELRKMFSTSGTLDSSLKNLRMRFWFEPKMTYTRGKAPSIDAFCTKRVFVWRPDIQFGFRPLIECKGNCATKTDDDGVPVQVQVPPRPFFFTEFAGCRYVHTISGGAFLMAGRYKCPKCSWKIMSSSDEFLEQQPPLWREYFPFLIMSKSAYEVSFLSMLLELWSIGVGTSVLANWIGRQRHAIYQRTRYRYLLSVADVEDFHRKADKAKAEAKQKSLWTFKGSHSGLVAFPAFEQHCKGYNEILAPTDQGLLEALQAYADRIEMLDYADRFMCGLTGEALSSDQHYKVPSRIRSLDQRTATRAQPVPGVYALANEWGQVLDYYWTLSSSHEELESLAEMVVKRGMQPVMWTTDLCCKVRVFVEVAGSMYTYLYGNLLPPYCRTQP